jgi:hypothetical protein
MRYLFGFMCMLALGVMGCSETAGTGGSGGDGGQGGVGGGVAACVDNVCPCTEAGIRAAIEGGGDEPYTFACDGPTTVTTADEIVIDNDVILDGEGNLTVDGDDDHRVFSVPAGVTAEFAGLSIRRGSALGDVFEEQIGGGILNDGTLTLMNSTVSGNTASYAGGIESNGPLMLTNSTVSGNAGGGIRSNGPFTLTNSTVSGNEGIANVGGLLTLTNSTVSGNGDYGIIIERAASATVTDSLVDGDCIGPITSNGYNIESPGDTCGFNQTGDLVNVSEDDLKLGPLQNAGGPTMTHPLGVGSVAINHIPVVDCRVETDQRGAPRPVELGCDVGAFEWCDRVLFEWCP